LGQSVEGSYEVTPIFRMSRLLRKPDGRLEGQLEATGELPTFLQEILDNQLPFPAAKFQKTAS
ncbi:MAG: CpaF family protein, partial [Bdellovibrio sp.]